MLLAPIGNPEPRDFTPLDTPYIFLENGTQTVKMQFDTFPQKIQNRCNLHPCEDENYSGFVFAAHNTFVCAAQGITPTNTRQSVSHGCSLSGCA